MAIITLYYLQKKNILYLIHIHRKIPLNLSEPTCIMQHNGWMVQMPNKISKVWIEKLQNKCKSLYLASSSLERQHFHQHERKKALFSVETENEKANKFRFIDFQITRMFSTGYGKSFNCARTLTTISNGF